MILDDWRPNPEEVHRMEQQWLIFSTKLDEYLEKLRQVIPIVWKESGMTDDSMTFSYMWASLQKSHVQGGLCDRCRVQPAIKETEVMLAAAMTRLTRAARVEDDMSQFERKYQDGNC